MPKIGIVSLLGNRCRCGHEWISRKSKQRPRVCPKCKSPNWDLPKLFSKADKQKKLKSYRLGELFSGAGGIGLGGKLAKLKTDSGFVSVEHVWANDYEEDACETYKSNLVNGNHTNVICEDVRELNFSDLEPIDALAFGFPCNDFSIVGEHKGIDGNFGPLYSYGVQALQIFQPDWFIAENVTGLGSANNGEAFAQILKELLDSGYNITPHMYQFEKYGVPQTRHRIVIVGIRSDLNLSFKVPKPTHSTLISCKSAISNPPIKLDSPNHQFTHNTPSVIERLKHIKPGENAFTADLPEELRLNVKSAKLSQIYKRLNPDLPSYTVTGSGGGGTHVYHWDENRALTNRERARLQTFPDNFVFLGGKESVRKQIGMAVPPKAAKIIIRAILKTLHGIPYKFVPENINQTGVRIKNKTKDY